ncbi:hypothetical protein H7H37_14830, partial [Mycolicibacterium insubricum]|nr:hypothetical protein [Mycolicibacterium insubricum]
MPVVLPTAVCPDAPVVRVLFEAEEAWPSVRGPLVAVAGAAIALVAATAVAVGLNSSPGPQAVTQAEAPAATAPQAAPSPPA